MRDVSRGAVYALKVPYRFCALTTYDSQHLVTVHRGRAQVKEGLLIRRWINLIQEATAVLLGKHASEPPRLVLEWLDVHDLYEQDIAWLCALDLEGAGEVVDLGEVDVLDVVG